MPSIWKGSTGEIHEELLDNDNITTNILIPSSLSSFFPFLLNLNITVDNQIHQLPFWMSLELAGMDPFQRDVQHIPEDILRTTVSQSLLIRKGNTVFTLLLCPIPGKDPFQPQ